MTPTNPDQVRIYEIKDPDGIPTSLLAVFYKFDGDITIQQQIDVTALSNEALGAFVREHLKVGAEAPEAADPAP